MSLSQGYAVLDRRRDVNLGSRYRFFYRESSGQSRSDGGSKGTSRAMGVGGIIAQIGILAKMATIEEQVYKLNDVR